MKSNKEKEEPEDMDMYVTAEDPDDGYWHEWYNEDGPKCVFEE